MIEHLSTRQFLAVFAVSAVIGGAVWIHADRHGSKRPTAWGIATVLAPGLVVTIYLIHYYRVKRRKRVG